MLPQAAETMPLGTSGVPAPVAALVSAPADYQREYEALMAWCAQGWRAKQRYDEDCPDCGGTLRYYQSRDRWFCLMCEKSRRNP